MSKKRAKLPQKSRDQGDKKTDKSVNILGVTITGTRKSQVLSKIFVQRKNLLHLATVNSEFVMQAKYNPRFADVLDACDMRVADGWGIVWAAQILYGQRIERVTGGMITEAILERASTRGEKVFLLGAAPGVAAKAAEAMKNRYRELKISWYEGATSIKLEGRDESSMTIAKINAYEPHYLLVAYGSPWQDMWIEENRPYLRVKVAIGIGGLLDEWAGVVRVCPEWLDRIGGKWLWRLVTEPWRIKRIANVWKFGLLVLWERFKSIL